MERTLVLIKPDAFERKMVSRILGRIEEKGLKMVDIKYWEKIDRSKIEEHYKQDMGKAHFSANCDFMTRGPIMSVVYEGEDAIKHIRAIQGTRYVPGTIRGDWVIDFRENLIHASDSPESALREIQLWFPGPIKLTINRKLELSDILL